ncbi:uncharacterized protein LOC141836013 [Curcuma longa]|uniref:uncharacterized protein LOC141836013 n=1 Tax=Curcuma longa TaxID=136217 RepID=UPI003D9DBD42
MLKMLRPEIALNVASGVHRPQTSEELVSSALITEHYLNSMQQQKSAIVDSKGQGSSGTQKPQGHNSNWKGKNQGKRKQWNNPKGEPANKQAKYPTCSTCGRQHLGVCRKGTRGCYNCGQEGHMAKHCPTKNSLPTPQPTQYGGKPAQLHQMQAALDGPHISQGRLEAPSATTNARVFSLTREDVANASTVVTGQICILQQNATVLFDTGATHSFISRAFVEKLAIPPDVLGGQFLTTLPSGEIMASTHRLRAVPVRIADRELFGDLIVLHMTDYDVILGMDFLIKYGASIECCKQKVVFQPKEGVQFEYIGEPKRKAKKFLSALKAQKLLDTGCTRFLAHVVNTESEKDQKLEEVRVVCDYPAVFPDELPGLAPDRDQI